MSKLLSASTPFQVGTSKLQALGSKYVQDSTNRVWFYSYNVTSIAAGKELVSATQEANHIDLAPAVAAIGAEEITVTLGATAVTANLYQDGFAVVQDNTGEGRAYPISGHPAAALSATCKISLGEALSLAIDATTDVDLVKNRYQDLVISVADQADPIAGIYNVAVGSVSYAWIQTWGPCAAWHDEAVAAGLAITTGTGTVGQVEGLDGAGEAQMGIQSAVAGADGDYQLVYLTSDR